MKPDSALVHARSNRARFLAELKSFLEFPSIGGQPAHSRDVQRCAGWLARHLNGIGLERVKLFRTRGHPIVYGERRRAPGRPTVLIYGHYDVQPVDPIVQWKTPPFQPTVLGDRIHARGACDDKGQMFTHVKAIESYLRSSGALPINVKCLFEGEEEIGSPNLAGFIERNRRALAADVALMSDTRMLGRDRPSLTYSLRGQLGMEIEVRGPRHDLHSGNFGGAVHNPLQALCEIIARLHDQNGRVSIPGFYDRVRRLDRAERDFMRGTGPRGAQILRDAGTDLGHGEKGYSAYERVTVRPALTINGISGGYAGPGGKGVIPSRAMAKLSFRLVPDQQPVAVEALIRRHLERLTPPTVKLSIRIHQSAHPAIIDRRHPALRAAALAYQRGFGHGPVFLRSGGTIPVVNDLQTILGISTVLMGFALPEDRIHAPNESFSLANFCKGIETSIWFLSEMAHVSGVGRRLKWPLTQLVDTRAFETADYS